MAEINVRRRRAPGLWPWVVGLLVLSLVVWGTTELLDRDAAAGLDGAAPSTGAP